MRARLAAALVVLLPATATAGGASTPYEATGEGLCECAEEFEQRHTHDVNVTLDDRPLTDGVHVVVDDAHAGVHITVNITVREGEP
jgi:hypothetical protein